MARGVDAERTYDALASEYNTQQLYSCTLVSNGDYLPGQSGASRGPLNLASRILHKYILSGTINESSSLGGEVLPRAAMDTHLRRNQQITRTTTKRPPKHQHQQEKYYCCSIAKYLSRYIYVLAFLSPFYLSPTVLSFSLAFSFVYLFIPVSLSSPSVALSPRRLSSIGCRRNMTLHTIDTTAHELRQNLHLTYLLHRDRPTADPLQYCDKPIDVIQQAY